MRTPLQKGEKILLVTHSTGVTLLGPGLIAVLCLVASYFIGFTRNWGWVLAVAGLVYFLAKYLTWSVNIWVVTSLRVIDEAGYLNHFAKESPLDKINNVSYDQQLWGRIFNFGHVEIQTAAQIGVTDYYMVNHPRRLKDAITQARSDLDRMRLRNQAMEMADAIGIRKGTGIASELEKLFELKQKGVLSEDEYQKAKIKILKD
jgi:uncharacterized membrane protein YdbT with pleckstrin-like domain